MPSQLSNLVRTKEIIIRHKYLNPSVHIQPGKMRVEERRGRDREETGLINSCLHYWQLTLSSPSPARPSRYSRHASTVTTRAIAPAQPSGRGNVASDHVVTVTWLFVEMRRRYTLLGLARVNIGGQACSVHVRPFFLLFFYSSISSVPLPPSLSSFPLFSLSLFLLSVSPPPLWWDRSIERQSRLFRMRHAIRFNFKYVPRAVDATEKVQRTIFLTIEHAIRQIRSK